MEVGRNSQSTTVQLGVKDSAEALVQLDVPDYDARIVVNRDDGRERWTFGVDDGQVSLIQTSESTDVLDQPDPPAWVETVLWEVGVPEVTT
jgi:hypothetical protein